MKRSNHIISLILLLCINCVIYCQIPNEQDCAGAIPITTYNLYNPHSYTGMGNIPNEIPTGGGCPGNCMIDGEKNCVWYVVQFIDSGSFGFEIVPYYSSEDYDWVVYNLTNNNCENIKLFADELQASCNWSGTPGATGPNGGNSSACVGASGSNKCALISVDDGETYVINISNWSNNQGGFELDLSMTTASFDPTTGIDRNSDISNKELKLCPNPNNGDFSIKIPQNILNHEKECTIRICNTNGVMVENFIIETQQLIQNHKLRINIKNKGIYFIELRSIKYRIVEKVVII